MNQNNIEELLRQYGEDQRQQRETATRLRKLAQRQARRRTALACIVVALAGCGIVTFRWMQQSEPTEDLVAKQPALETTLTTNHATESVGEAPMQLNTHKRVKRQHLAPHPSTIPTLPTEKMSDTTSSVADFPYESQYEYEKVTIPDDTSTNVPSAIPPTPYPMEASREIASAEGQPLLQNQQTNRLHFIAAICASTVSNMANGMYDPSLNGLTNESSNYYTDITSGNSVSANIGVAYTFASNNRHHLDIGVGLNGYSQKNDLHIHQANTIVTSSWTTDSYTSFNNYTDEYYSFSTMSLYASLPLTFYLHPRGKDRPGWQMSIIPAHSLATLHSVDIKQEYTLNPWKLTLGLGVALPQSPIHRVSLTVNLLPLYQTGQLREFGIELGI